MFNKFKFVLISYIFGSFLFVLFFQNFTSSEKYLLDERVFNCDYYIKANPDLSFSTCELYQKHWVETGVAQMRRAHPLFSIREYLSMYEDLKNTFGADSKKYIQHYLNEGIQKNFAGRYLTHPSVFECSFYSKNYPGLENKTCNELALDFVNTFEFEGKTRFAHPLFDIEQYLSLYPDLLPNIIEKKPMQALRHYVLFGSKVGRVGNEYLRSRYYNCEDYKNNNQQLLDQEIKLESSTNYCEALAKHWIIHGLRNGLVANNSFSIKNYIGTVKPRLGEFFGDNYLLAWDFVVHGEDFNPFKVIPLADDTQSLFSLDDRMIFDVTKYGADNTGVEDSTSAINNTIAAAALYTEKKSNKKAAVYFPNGNNFKSKYRLNCITNITKDDYTPCLSLQKLKRILFFGDVGAKLVSNNPLKPVIKLESSEDIYFSNLTIDYLTAPFVQGKIIELTEITSGGAKQVKMTIEINPSFSQVGIEQVISDGFGIFFDSIKPERKRSTWPHVKPVAIEDVTEPAAMTKSWVFTFDGSLAKSRWNNVAVNDRFIYANRRDATLSFDSNKNIGINSLVVHASPGLAISFRNNYGKEIIINNLQVRREYNSPRIFTSNADGINAQNNYTGFRIQNSYFEGMGDDAINISAKGKFIVDFNLENKTIVFCLGQDQMEINDELQFVDPSSGSEIFRAKVKKIDHIAKVDLNAKCGVFVRVTIDNMNEFINKGNGTMPDAEFSYVNTILFNYSASGKNSIIQNNIFGPNRARGIILGAGYTNILSNWFMHIDTSAIVINPSLNTFILGPIPESVNVEHNYISGGNTTNSSLAISKQSLQYFDSKESLGDSKITITNNKFQDCGAVCISVKNL
jgi:hypothetical protein